MDAEPLVARFQMEHQPRRPGYAKRSALILKRRGKRARLFRDRAISTLIFDEREMELLAHHSVIVRVAAAFWTAGDMESAARRLKRAVLVVPADVNPSS